jgi:ATP-dependent protease ClpP protease subunit
LHKIEIKGAIVSNDLKEVYDFYGMDSTCPKDVVNALEKAKGEPVVTEINSGGGDVFAGSEINTLLSSYSGKVTQNIIFAASAASVIAMAGESYIAPTGMMMIHNVSCSSKGDHNKMRHTSEMLEKANKAVANAYVAKTGKSVEEALSLMEAETWFTAKEAKEHGLVDWIMFEESNNNVQLVASLNNILPKELIDKYYLNKSKNDSILKAKCELEYLKLGVIK